MSKFAGILSTDTYGVPMDEMRLAHIQYSAAETAAADADGLLNDTALGATATTVTTFLAQPPYPRNITIVASATQTGDCVINGTNINDKIITETITFNSATPVVGAKAFKTVTSVVLPVKAGSETCDIGWGQLIGLPVMLSEKPLGFALNDGAFDTAPTFVVDADELEKNTVDFNGSLDGSVMDLFIAI